MQDQNSSPKTTEGSPLPGFAQVDAGAAQGGN